MQNRQRNQVLGVARREGMVAGGGGGRKRWKRWAAAAAGRFEGSPTKQLNHEVFPLGGDGLLLPWAHVHQPGGIQVAMFFSVHFCPLHTLRVHPDRTLKRKLRNWPLQAQDDRVRIMSAERWHDMHLA